MAPVKLLNHKGLMECSHLCRGLFKLRVRVGSLFTLLALFGRTVWRDFFHFIMTCRRWYAQLCLHYVCRWILPQFGVLGQQSLSLVNERIQFLILTNQERFWERLSVAGYRVYVCGGKCPFKVTATSLHGVQKVCIVNSKCRVEQQHFSSVMYTARAVYMLLMVFPFS